jgi:hypothetical protein
MSLHRRSYCYIVIIQMTRHVLVIVVWVPNIPAQNIGQGFLS